MIDSQELEIRIEQTRKALIKLLNKKLNAQSGGFFVPLAGNASWSKKPEWSSNDDESSPSRRVKRKHKSGFVIELIEDLINEGQVFAVYGESGSGKTTCFLKSALDRLEDYTPGGRLCVLGDLRRFKDMDILSFLHNLSRGVCKGGLQREDWDILAEENRLDIFLDGYDECPREQLSSLNNELETMLLHYDPVRLVISSCEEISFSQWPKNKVDIRPLEEKEQRTFLEQSLKLSGSQTTRLLKKLHHRDAEQNGDRCGDPRSGLPAGAVIARYPLHLKTFVAWFGGRVNDTNDIDEAIDKLEPRTITLQLFRNLFDDLYRRERDDKNFTEFSRQQNAPLHDALAELAFDALLNSCNDSPSRDILDPLRHVFNEKASNVLKRISEWPFFDLDEKGEIFRFEHADFRDCFAAGHLLLKPERVDELIASKSIDELPFLLACVFRYGSDNNRLDRKLISTFWEQNPLWVAMLLRDINLLREHRLPTKLAANPWWQGIIKVLKNEQANRETAEIRKSPLSPPPYEILKTLSSPWIWADSDYERIEIRVDKLWDMLTTSSEPWADLLHSCCKGNPEWLQRLGRDSHDCPNLAVLLDILLTGDESLRNQSGDDCLPAEIDQNGISQADLSIVARDFLTYSYPKSDGDQLLRLWSETPNGLSRRQWNGVWRRLDNDDHQFTLSDPDKFPAAAVSQDMVAKTKSPSVAAAAIRFVGMDPERFTRKQKVYWIESASFYEARSLVIAEILEWRDFPDEKWLEWDEASHTSLAPQEQDRWFERWEDPEERFRDPPNWPGLEWEPYEGYLAEVYKPYGMRLKNMSMGEVCGNLDCFHLAASPDLENSSLLLSLLPQEEVEQPPAIPSDWRNAHSLSELRRIAESMDSAELPPELLEKAKEYILRLTPIVVRGDSVKLTPWETTPAQPINSKPRVLKPSGDISDIPKTKDNDITNQTGELINPYSLQSAANAVCFWVNHGAITPEDIPSQHLNTWKCSPHEGQSPDVSDLEAICSIVQADITDWDRMPGHWISKVADICQFKAHDPPCRPIAGYGTREELEAGQADDISVACALAQFIAPGMVTDANRDIWIHNASAHMAFALIQEGLLKADDFDDFVEHEAIVCDIILLIAAGMACWRDTPTTRDLWMYARFARCVRLLCRQKQFDPSDVPPALRQHWGQIADPRQIADLIRANLLNADDIPQSRKDGWRESCLEIDLAQLVDVGVLAIDELADDIKSRLTKPIDVVIADLAGILPENWPGLLPADCDSVRRELQSTSKLRTLLENWEVDLPAELFDKITKNPPTREQSDRTDGDKSTKKTKSRRRKKQTNQKIKTKEMILLGAIMAYHQFGSEKENLIPTSQTILGEVAGGMTQSDVSRTMKRLFGENPSKGYKRILREPNPLEGFIKKGELLGIPNDVEAPYYRPSHPTEAEERQSENT